MNIWKTEICIFHRSNSLCWDVFIKNIKVTTKNNINILQQTQIEEAGGHHNQSTKYQPVQNKN